MSLDETLSNEVRLIISEELGIEFNKIKRDSTFESLGADSLDVMNVVMEIEAEYNVSFSGDYELTRVGEIVQYISDNYRKK
ncbi:MAG: phosphopantetheine-binding protein [Nanoarchaeota archaeon]